MTIIHRHELDNIAVLTWDQPGSPVNTKTPEAVEELGRVLGEALTDPNVLGVVLTSAKRGFVAGGNLKDLQEITEPDDARDLVARVREIMRALETSGKPVVAAINGDAMGGGLELVLACHARVAAADARLGLPEVTLGLMPGAGGTQRLPRLIGMAAALPLLTDGKPIDAEQALSLKLVDRVVPSSELIATAVMLASNIGAVQPWDDPSTPSGGFDPALIANARRICERRSGKADIAEAAIIDVVEQGMTQPFDVALDLEQRSFVELVVSPAAKNRIRTQFFAMNHARAIKFRPANVPTYEPRCVAVVGAGTMGAGIAYTAAAAGMKVRVVEQNPESLERGLGVIAATADRQVKAGRVDASERNAIMARIHGQVGYQDLYDVDLAVEAVVEVEAVKAEVLVALQAAMRPGVPLASNTSTLPISRLANYCNDPTTFIGAHFFGPVERMPLVEVIRGDATSERTLAWLLDLLKMMRKVPIVVNDGLGFYTSRVVAAYSGEAMILIKEGVAPMTIDQVATDFGMVIGPCAMNDITGLPLLLDIFSSVGSDPERMTNQSNLSIETLRTLIAAGRTGRRDGEGIYDYADGKPLPWTGLVELFPHADQLLSTDIIEQRLMHAQALEAARALEEGIVHTASDADVGSVLGWMFPKGFGGILSYVDTIGSTKFVAQCQALERQFGVRFRVPEMLLNMAKSNSRFHSL